MPTLAAGILMKLDSRKAGVILNEMDRKAAAMLTGIMASAAAQRRSDMIRMICSSWSSSPSLALPAAAPTLQRDRPASRRCRRSARASTGAPTPPDRRYPKRRRAVKRFSLWNDRQSRLFTDPRALSPATS